MNMVISIWKHNYKSLCHRGKLYCAVYETEMPTENMQDVYVKRYFTLRIFAIYGIFFRVLGSAILPNRRPPNHFADWNIFIKEWMFEYLSMSFFEVWLRPWFFIRYNTTGHTTPHPHHTTPHTTPHHTTPPRHTTPHNCLIKILRRSASG